MNVDRHVYIEPGFGEGEWHSRILYKSLEKLGYRRVATAADSDVVITHSAGCFFLPPRLPHQKVVVLAPPYWPGKYLWWCFLQKITQDILESYMRGKLLFFIRKTIWNCLYILRDIPKAIRIHFSARRHDFYTAFHSEKFVLIRNKRDTFCTPDIERLLRQKGKFEYYELPGEHEEVWMEPDDHAALIHSILQPKS